MRKQGRVRGHIILDDVPYHGQWQKANMGHIVDEITREAQALGITLIVVAADETRALREGVRKRYNPPLWSGRIESNLIEAGGIHDPDGWMLIADFVGSNSTVMFFEEADDRLGVRFPNGETLTTVLRETTGPVLYLTDDGLSYLICFNFHDVLIGAGSARGWIAQLKAERLLDGSDELDV
jgi:hypothetical protein